MFVEKGHSDGSKVDITTATMEHVDKAHWVRTDDPLREEGRYAIKMIGYFTPAYTGRYKFCVKTIHDDSPATVYMSSTEDPADKVMVVFMFSKLGNIQLRNPMILIV